MQFYPDIETKQPTYQPNKIRTIFCVFIFYNSLAKTKQNKLKKKKKKIALR